MVFSLAWRMTGDRGLAEEVAQDVFLELDRHMDRIESPEHALFWLRRVADESFGRCAAAAKGARRGSVGGDRGESRVTDGGAVITLDARLEQLLSTLPEAQRAALVLRYQEDLTPEEIAATVDSPVGDREEQFASWD